MVRRRSLRIGATIAVVALTQFVSATVAQTPESGASDEMHPVHIHAGSCAELGDVVVPLADFAFPEGEFAGADTATSVKVSLNALDMPVEELLAGEFAINVHQSAEAIDTYIACGDIGGIVTPGVDGDEVRFMLAEQNDSGHIGTAFLGTVDGRTELNIMLIEPEEMS
jgi:hypothetical protein